MKFKSNIEIQAGVEAGGSTGSNGQVLSSTGSGVAWINQGAVTTASDFVFFNVKNETGSAILKGKGVMAVGTDGNSGHILIDEMVANGTVEAKYFLGVLEEDIPNGGFARVISFGQLDQFNTTGQNGETWNDGQILWCDPANPGDFTITEPEGPNVKIAAAFILNSSTNGKIQVRVQANEGVHDLHDTKITSQVDGDVLVWDNTTGVWFNDSTLNVDYTNGRVGIGTTTPGYKLDVDGVITATGGNSTQWNTAYTDRNKWDGGATGLNASNGRISLGLGTLAILNTVDAATITDNSVGAAELNVSGNGTTAQYLRSDGDGTFTWATPTNTTYGVATDTVLGLVELFSNTDQTVAANAVTTTAGRTYGLQLNSANQGVINVPWTDTNTTYTAGVGLTLAGTEFSHADTSSQASVNNTGRTFIQDITLDDFGHVTGLVSATDADTFTGTVTSVAASAGTGISVSGSPITTSGTITITNTAPDTGVPAILSNGSVPSLNTGITAAEVRSLIGAGTSSTTGTVTSVATGGGLTGGTITTSGTISHADTSSQASVDNSNGIVIQDVTLDTYGHVTGLASVNLDGRYYTETESDSRFVNVTGDTMTGPLTIDTGSSTNALVIKGTSPTISLLDDSGEDDFYIHVNSNNFYVLVNRDANDLVGTGYESPHPLQLEGDTNIGYLFDSRIFADNYHPNADAWTTARTITIGNTGKSVSGSANVSWTLAEIGATNEAYVDLEIATRTPLNDIRSLGTNAFTNGTDPNITTAQVMAEIEGDGGFDSYSSVFKTSWSYAGNYNLTDAGNFTETAGSSWITWTDNSSDTTRGNITALAIAPNTGASAGGVFIYNDQGSGYSPGWRQVWTSTTDGSGSGLDADLLDGQQGSYYAPATGGAYLPLSGGTMSGTLNMNGQTLNMVNGNITAINNLTFNDPGPNEGIEWNGGNGWKIYESPDNLTTNSGGSLQFVTGSTRRMTIDTSGNVFALGSSRAPIFYDSNDTGYYLNPASTSNLNVVNANQFTGPLNGTANGNAFARGRVVNNCNDAAYRVPGMYGFNGNPTNGTGESYGTMIVAANSDTGLQIAGGYQNDDLYFRGWWSSGAGYGSWRRILHDANYTSWVPSKTGSGASGTWGISITGNATTATTAAWADQVDVNGSNSGGGEYPVMWNSGDTVYSTAGITINRDNKSITASGSLRAPIFYDSNDTGYYLNPASTSTVNKVNYINNSIPIVVKLNSVHKSWAHHVSASDDYVLVPSGTDGGEDWAWSSGFNFNSTGNITANNFILRSDERLKTKITDLPCDNIDAAWKSFELKSDKGNYRTGVIAQELEIKHPEFVNTDNEGFKSVKYIDLLIAKIAELEARLEKAGI